MPPSARSVPDPEVPDIAGGLANRPRDGRGSVSISQPSEEEAQGACEQVETDGDGRKRAKTIVWSDQTEPSRTSHATGKPPHLTAHWVSWRVCALQRKFHDWGESRALLQTADTSRAILRLASAGVYAKLALPSGARAPARRLLPEHPPPVPIV